MSSHLIRTGGSGFALEGNLLNFLSGLYDMGILVFLLVFTIVFAVLQKSQILGSGKKNFNVSVALVMGLLVIIPHMTGQYAPGYDVVDIVNTALPDISLLAIAAIMLLMLIGLFGGEARWMGGSLSGWMAIIGFIFVVVIFSSAAGWTSNFNVYDYTNSHSISICYNCMVHYKR
jgi:hypothetical protein